MSLTSYDRLVVDKEYIIYREGDDKFKTFWKGRFCGEYQRYFDNGPNLIFVDCIRTVDTQLKIVPREYTMNVGPYKNRVDFRKTDIFHDLEKVKDNSKTARDTMELRSLDILLKRLVNEEFEW